ncbi:MAG: response regulator [Bacteroidales bacterium]|nr:response regulator [Bacteroidales bacterium]
MSYKVLVVDDNEANRELIHGILRTAEENYKVMMAENGKIGFDMAVKELPDVIFMDMKMPELDGIETIKLLKAEEVTKTIPVIVVTAFNTPENLEAAFEAGAFDYITKPISIGELKSRAKRAITVIESFRQVQEKIDKVEGEKHELEKIAMVSGTSSFAFLIVRTNGELEWANEGFEKIHGYKLDEFKSVFGNTIFSLTSTADIVTIFNRCLKNKVPVDFISKIKPRRGEEKWIQTFINPQVNADDTIEKLLIVEIDISIFKKKEEELNLQYRKMREISQNLEKANTLLGEQTLEINRQKRQIEEEQEKSEKLLLNILPFEIARQLKSKGRAGTRQYKLVTVLFADFKGFSKISKTLEPKDLVSILDSYFAKFDEIIGTHYLEKIKTIGDAYMCAGGLPLSNKSNPIDALLAGLEIQQYMNTLNDSKVLNNLSVWELRLGIHTGAVVAGVVGRKRVAYDIWGDTVNIASRMEQSGYVGMVNISGTTYEYIKDFFDCQYRGKVEAKNLGKVDMYFVDRIKPKYSADKLGLKPNEEFINLINKL